MRFATRRSWLGRSWFGKPWQVLLGLVRLLALLAAFDLMGGNDAIVFVVAGADECCADCPLQHEEEPCAPGCPNCHCARVNVALPAMDSSAIASSSPMDVRLDLAPYEARVPRAPPLPGIYRPPRNS